MVNVQYWRHGELLGTDVNIGEYHNDLEDGRCPFCHRKVSTIYCIDEEYTDENGQKWLEKPIGCFECVESYEDDESGYVHFDENEWVDWDLEYRSFCRGTAYEY